MTSLSGDATPSLGSSTDPSTTSSSRSSSNRSVGVRYVQQPGGQTDDTNPVHVANATDGNSITADTPKSESDKTTNTRRSSMANKNDANDSESPTSSTPVFVIRECDLPANVSAPTSKCDTVDYDDVYAVSRMLVATEKRIMEWLAEHDDGVFSATKPKTKQNSTSNNNSNNNSTESRYSSAAAASAGAATVESEMDDPALLHDQALIASRPMDRHRGVFILDVRSRPEHERGSIPGACNIPLQELDRALSVAVDADEFVDIFGFGMPDRTTPIIVFGYGRGGLIAGKACDLLRYRGYNRVKKYAEGYSEFQRGCCCCVCCC